MNRTKSITQKLGLDKEDARWFAIRTRYKSEKVVSKLLTVKGVESYLPMQKVTRRYNRKIKHLELPLISCYVFVKITKEHYVPVLETEHVAGFLRIGKELTSIPQEEIDLMRRVVGEGLSVSAEPRTLYEGATVEIVKGNLAGLRGTLIQQKGKNQMVVELDNLDYQLKIEVPQDMIDIV